MLPQIFFISSLTPSFEPSSGSQLACSMSKATLESLVGFLSILEQWNHRATGVYTSIYFCTSRELQRLLTCNHYYKKINFDNEWSTLSKETYVPIFQVLSLKQIFKRSQIMLMSLGHIHPIPILQTRSIHDSIMTWNFV